MTCPVCDLEEYPSCICDDASSRLGPRGTTRVEISPWLHRQRLGLAAQALLAELTQVVQIEDRDGDDENLVSDGRKLEGPTQGRIEGYVRPTDGPWVRRKQA